MAYVIVEDVPASWERYRGIEPVLARPAPGLLLHLAGPTDEGFRIVEVWEDEAAWRRYSAVFEAALGSVDPAVRLRTATRDLRAVHVVRGSGWRQPEIGE